MYLHLVENRRPDLDLILEGVGGEALPPLRFDPDRDPLYFTHHPNWNLPELSIVPLGVVFKACRSDRPPPEPVISKRRLDGEDDPWVPKDYLTQNLIGHFHYMLGLALIERDWPGARREFEAAMTASPGNDVLFYNLGLIYRMNGLLEEAADAFRRSHAINPRHIANIQQSRASDKLAEIEAEKAAPRRRHSEDHSLGRWSPGAASRYGAVPAQARRRPARQGRARGGSGVRAARRRARGVGGRSRTLSPCRMTFP